MKEITDLIGNVNMEQFEAVLAKAESQQNEFYQKVIELHNDERLRSLAKLSPNLYGSDLQEPKPCFKIYERSGDLLCYGGKGFEAYVEICVERGNYLESGVYETRLYLGNVKNNKLRIDKQDLLDYFPNLTLEKIISKIEAGIKALPMYKNMEGEK